MASRLVKQKNIPLGLEAFSIFRSGLAEVERKQVSLVLVGSGPEESSIHARAQALGLEGVAMYESWTSDLATYIKSADAFVLSSDYEGWGMTIVEASAATIPVIMTDVGCAGELITSEKEGLIVSPREPAKLAEAMKRLYTDRDLARRLAQAAHDKVGTPDIAEHVRAIVTSWAI